MSANILAFPIQTTCGVCGRACSEDDLGGCFTCGDTFCGKTGCKVICACDRLALDMADRLAELKPGLLRRLVSRVAHAVRGKNAA